MRSIRLLPAEVSRSAVLVALLAHSVRRGHYKLALRRSLMLQACGLDVPEQYRAYCEAAALRCREPELARLRQCVDLWAAMLQPHRPWWLDAGAARH